MKKSTLIDFGQGASVEDWEIVNDAVMGGHSASDFIVSEASTAVFCGAISLENQGGFASIRTLPGEYDLSGFDGLFLLVRGDGRRYTLRVRTDDAFEGVAYQKSFETRKNEWVTVRVLLEELKASFRGRSVPDAPPLVPGRVRRIGFLIADKREGPFRLEIARIGAYSLQGESEVTGNGEQPAP